MKLVAPGVSKLSVELIPKSASQRGTGEEDYIIKGNLFLETAPNKFYSKNQIQNLSKAKHHKLETLDHVLCCT